MIHSTGLIKGILMVVPILCDRITKLLALNLCTSPVQFGQFVQCEVVFNRGISWSLLASSSEKIFWVITGIIIAITGFILWRLSQRAAQGKNSAGEFLVFSGSISNIFDRFMYGGVVDFIELSWKEYSFPVFNLADCYIVIGVMVMLYQQWREQ